MAQIALADACCILILPFAAAPHGGYLAVLGALAIAVAAALLALLLLRFGRTRLRASIHIASERRRLALELRLSLLVLFALAALAQVAGVSIMLAGFALGLVLSKVGEPRRLAHQLFGMTEGFFGPLFFVWLGASLDACALGGHPAMILLGALITVAAATVALPVAARPHAVRRNARPRTTARKGPRR